MEGLIAGGDPGEVVAEEVLDLLLVPEVEAGAGLSEVFLRFSCDGGVGGSFLFEPGQQVVVVAEETRRAVFGVLFSLPE